MHCGSFSESYMHFQLSLSVWVYFWLIFSVSLLFFYVIRDKTEQHHAPLHPLSVNKILEQKRSIWRGKQIFCFNAMGLWGFWYLKAKHRRLRGDWSLKNPNNMADSSEKVSFRVDMQCSSLRAEAFLVFDRASQPTLGQQITDILPTVGWQSADKQPTVGRLLADSRPTVGQQPFFGGAVLHFFR